MHKQARNAEVMRTYLEEVAAKNRLELIPDLAHDDMVDDVSVMLGGPTGRDGLVFHVQTFFGWLGDPRITIRRIVADDDTVMAWWLVEGRHVGELMGIPPSNETVSASALSMFTMRDGKIARYSLLGAVNLATPLVVDTIAALGS
jgi:steroid delta-isomerase-like uncharacterized protein